jgi:agmatine deiminase
MPANHAPLSPPSRPCGSLLLEAPLALGLRMPAEWSPHACCWMAWPSREDQWVDGLAATQRTYAAVAQAIRRFEPVRMVAEPQAAAAARALCGPDIDVVEWPLDDPWMRDTGPSFLTGTDGARGGTAWRFNSWGGKTPDYAENARLAGRLLAAVGVPQYQSSLCLEGGAVQVDGEGTVITTESVVLNANRNPGISRTAAERELCAALGASRVIWLPGDPDGMHTDITDGHIDGLVAYVKPGVVLFESDPGASGAALQLAAENRRALESAQDARGRRLQIISIDDAHEVETPHRLFCRSYVNFYLANGGLVMPSYGVPGDARARAVIQAAFPDREIIQVDVTALACGGGGIHCITQQQPA